jgi:tetratricopeptide (TPR) repeat protein
VGRHARGGEAPGQSGIALARTGPERAELLPQLAFALFEIGDLATLQTVVDETTETAAASGDSRLAAYATIVGLWIRLSWETEGWADMAEQEATKALAAFEAAADERGLAKASALLGLVHLERAQFRAAEAAYARTADHAREAGDRRDELESCVGTAHGPGWADAPSSPVWSDAAKWRSEPKATPRLRRAC